MRPLPSPSAGLPRCSNHHAYVPCPLPRRIGTGAFVDCFPVPRGLPQTLGGSASALSFSRPAQASLALRPARLLNRPRRPLSRGFDGAGCPATPPVSYQLNRQLAGWNPPPQVIRASEAHQRLRTRPAPTVECRGPIFLGPQVVHKQKPTFTTMRAVAAQAISRQAAGAGHWCHRPAHGLPRPL